MAGIDITSPSVPVGFRVFSGGLNSTTNPLSLKDEEASDLQNIDFDKFGSILKRNGYTALNTTAFNASASWTSLHFLQLSTGTDFIMGTCGNKLAKMDAFDGTWDDITGVLTITAGNDNKFKWITFKDIAFGTNNVNVPIKWDGIAAAGTTWTVPAALTKAKWTETWNNYTFLANVEIGGTKQTTRIYWSALNDPEVWDVADFAEIGLKDGEEITGVEALGDRLVIFKESSIYIALFTGDADIPFTFQKTQSSVGAISGYSIQEVENGLLFYAQDGFYYFDGNNSLKISDRIATTLSLLNKQKFEQVVSTYQREKNRYWAAMATSGTATNDRIIPWDSYNNAFSVYKGINANAFVTLKTSGEERVYFGDYSGFVYRADNGTNDKPLNVSTAIDGFYKTRWFNYDDLVDTKGVPHAVVYYNCSDSTLIFSYSFDLEDGSQFSLSFSLSCPGSLWDSAIWDVDLWGGSGGQLRRLDLKGRGRVVRFIFSNMNLGETFQIHGLGKLIFRDTYK